MSPPNEAIVLALQRLDEAKKQYLAGEAVSSDAVLDAAQAIIAAAGRDQDELPASSGDKNEKPSDFLQRVMWAEVSAVIEVSECDTECPHMVESVLERRRPECRACEASRLMSRGKSNRALLEVSARERRGRIDVNQR